jgi:hypothetical protein
VECRKEHDALFLMQAWQAISPSKTRHLVLEVRHCWQASGVLEAMIIIEEDKLRIKCEKIQESRGKCRKVDDKVSRKWPAFYTHDDVGKAVTRN